MLIMWEPKPVQRDVVRGTCIFCSAVCGCSGAGHLQPSHHIKAEVPGNSLQLTKWLSTEMETRVENPWSFLLKKAII